MKFKPSFQSQLPQVDYLTRLRKEPAIAIDLPPEEPDVLTPSVPDNLRDHHIHVLGKTGHGKTILLASQAVKDIRAEKGGVCVIDPKGGVGAMAEVVSRYIPEDRLEDCLWLDVKHPIPLDVMSCPPGKESIVVADLVYLLTEGKLDQSTAPDLSYNLNNLLHTLINANQHPDMPSEKRCTFLDIYRFLEESDRQKEILTYVRDRRFQNPWKPENYPDKTARSRLRTRIAPWINNHTLCTILGEPVPTLNLEDVVENKKILLVSVPDEDPASTFYGSLIVSKLQHAAFSAKRSDMAEEERTPFFLYIDEFEYFRAAAAFLKMLKMARSFKLCLTLANLHLKELDADVRSALQIVSSFILLRIASEDKAAFADEIGTHDPGEKARERERHAYRQWTHQKSDGAYTRWRIAFEEAQEFPDKLVTIEDAIKLNKYEAIFKIGNNPAVIAPTPQPPAPRPTPEEVNKLLKIKQRTMAWYGPTDANYARIIQNRSGDSGPLQRPQDSHTERNGNTDSKAEQTEGGHEPTPPHARQNTKP
jgi:hypothetical protein